MSTRYSDGAKTFIYTLIVAAVLAIGAIAVLIISFIEPEPRRVEFNAFEFIPTKTDSDLGCQFEKILQVVSAEDLGDWLERGSEHTLCLRKKADGFWVVFAFESEKNTPF